MVVYYLTWMSSIWQFLRLLIMILTVLKYLRHCRKKVYAHKFASKILFKYISHFPEVFILLNVENIANTILVALEVSYV